LTPHDPPDGLPVGTAPRSRWSLSSSKPRREARIARAAPYPITFVAGQAIAASVQAGGAAARAAARQFVIGDSTAIRWAKRWRETGSFEAKSNKGQSRSPNEGHALRPMQGNRSCALWP